MHTRTPQELRVPSSGASRNKARFDLEPRKEGPGEVTAIFYKDNNFIQGLTIQFNVGGQEGAFGAIEKLGRPVECANAVQPRDVMLFIKKAADGFTVTMVGPVATTATLPITSLDLNKKILQARDALREVVYLKKPGLGRVYQQKIEIPYDIAQEGMEILAEIDVDPRI